MSLTFGSLCSGIEAASCAWNPLGWKCAFVSEIEPFPCALLKHHYPEVPNYGDMLKFQEWPRQPIDVLVGGTPCQDFSVAGQRAGMGGARGGLTMRFLDCVGAYAPTWIVWENVPGVLSIDGGRAFGAFLGGLAKRGYGFAYRVLDAQYSGLAQRRERVFVVGCAGGNWQRAAAVLFDAPRLRWNPPPRRQAGQGTAPSISARTKGGGGLGTDAECDGALVAGTLGSAFGKQRGAGQQPEGLVSIAMAPNTRSNRYDAESQTLIAHSLTSAGFDASEDGTGRGTPLVATQDLQSEQVNGMRHHADATEANASEALRVLREAVGEAAFERWGTNVALAIRAPKVLQHQMYGAGIRRTSAEVTFVVADALPRPEDGSERIMPALWQAFGVGHPPHGWQLPEQLARQLGAYLSQLSHEGASGERNVQSLRASAERAGLLREALPTVQEVGRPARFQAQSAHAVAVRRLTVEEVETLFGFPRGYTLIPYRGKPACDGPRYRALGNSMAVPLVQWLGRRIEMVSRL